MTETSFSRRSFLTGAAALGSLAAVGAMAGCSPKAPADNAGTTDDALASTSGSPHGSPTPRRYRMPTAWKPSTPTCS